MTKGNAYDQTPLPAGRGSILPSHDMTIIQSVSYRDRSLSRGRTHMDLEDPNGVSEGDIGLPTPLTEFQR